MRRADLMQLTGCNSEDLKNWGRRGFTRWLTCHSDGWTEYTIEDAITIRAAMDLMAIGVQASTAFETVAKDMQALSHEMLCAVENHAVLVHRRGAASAWVDLARVARGLCQRDKAA
jgi:hypothetical protein